MLFVYKLCFETKCVRLADWERASLQEILDGHAPATLLPINVSFFLGYNLKPMILIWGCSYKDRTTYFIGFFYTGAPSQQLTERCISPKDSNVFAPW